MPRLTGLLPISSSFSSFMALPGAKTFAGPKKSSELQATEGFASLFV